MNTCTPSSRLGTTIMKTGRGMASCVSVKSTRPPSAEVDVASWRARSSCDRIIARIKGALQLRMNRYEYIRFAQVPDADSWRARSS